MRAPRRVPWSSRAELAELHELLFAPSSAPASRRRAVSRMAVYTSCPSCPAFMHLLHALVAADLVDTADDSHARLACAMAVVRFVNGMVDPLQTGPYARPISHLAAQLGIPPSLIALRHRATHEDLPPLALLKPAVAACLAYVNHFSLLPLLSTSSEAALDEFAGARVASLPLRESAADSLVRGWKRVMKERVRTRDVSKESDSGKEVRRLLREASEMDVDELLDAVVRGFIPVAKRKRPAKTASQPPAELLQVWEPLLASLPSSSVPSRLAAQILSNIPALVDDESARWTLATWLSWLWTRSSSLSLPDGDRRLVWAQVARMMGSGDWVYVFLAPRQWRHDFADPSMHRCYQLLCNIEPAGPVDLVELVEHGDARARDGVAEEDDEQLDGLEVGVDMPDASTTVILMEKRLQSIESRTSSGR